MAYNFEFNLRKLPKEFFVDVTKVAKKHKIHRKIGDTSKKLVKKFKVNEKLGVPLDDAVTLVEDLLDVYIDNIIVFDSIKTAKTKVLLIPHCCRKHMDSKCKARFDEKYSAYFCRSCSKDCYANIATKIGKERGYEVFILPGGSCIKKLMNHMKCDAVVGIACGEEIKLGKKFLDGKGVPILGIPLTKNGCSKTQFNVANLKKLMV